MTTRIYRQISVWLGILVIGVAGGHAWAAEFHVTTAQELQNALTTAAVNGAPDTIWLAAGYYTGNFNFSSAEAASLTLQPEPGVDATQVTVDGAGTGRSMNLACSAAAPITVTNLTFLRNCGAAANTGLRISTVGANVTVSNCRFIGPTNALGIGLEIVSGSNAYVRNCTATRIGASASGAGISISGVTTEVHVEGNTVSGNSQGTGDGIAISGTAAVWAIANVSTGNLGGKGGIYVSGTTLSIGGNTCAGNSSSGNGGGIYANGTSSITVSNNSVTGNSGNSSGGGISASGGSTVTIAITGNTITANSAGIGSGIYASGILTITGNTITGNSSSGSSGRGGGISANFYGSSTISGNTITGNSLSGSSMGGGGIYASGTSTASIAVTGNIITGNSCSGSGSLGGGIYASGSSTVTVAITGNTITGNSSGGHGGGIYASGTSTTPLTISANRIVRNRCTGATSCGGGLLASWPTIKINNNFVAGNSTATGANQGGGVYLTPTTRLELINNTLTSNSSGGDGGGAVIAISGVTELLYAYNNIVWGNSAIGNGKDVYLAGTGQRKEFLYNNAHDLYGVWDIAQNNIDAAPLFYDPLHDDYHLRFGSPGIDAGTNAVAMLPATDIDGDARVLNTAPDLGADEFNNQDYHPADINHDWVISDEEYTAYAAAWKNDQTWSPGPVPIPADYVTRAGYLKSQNGGTYYNAGGPKPVCWKTGTP